MSKDDQLNTHWPTIEKVIDYTCGRYRVYGEDRDDFSSFVREKIIENDFRILRKHRGDSTLKTYLTHVTHNLLQDYLVKKHGRWFASSEAKRLGPEAIELEKLLYNDGLNFDEAAEILITNRRLEVTWDALDSLAAKLPPRQRRRFVSPEILEIHSSGESAADASLKRQEQQSIQKKAQELLIGTIRRLNPEDQLILKMRFQDDVTVVKIAAALGLNKKKLYRRIERILTDLRKHLVRKGIRWEDLRYLIGNMYSDLHLEMWRKNGISADRSVY